MCNTQRTSTGFYRVTKYLFAIITVTKYLFVIIITQLQEQKISDINAASSYRSKTYRWKTSYQSRLGQLDILKAQYSKKLKKKKKTHIIYHAPTYIRRHSITLTWKNIMSFFFSFCAAGSLGGLFLLAPVFWVGNLNLCVSLGSRSGHFIHGYEHLLYFCTNFSFFLSSFFLSSVFG